MSDGLFSFQQWIAIGYLVLNVAAWGAVWLNGLRTGSDVHAWSGALLATWGLVALIEAVHAFALVSGLAP